VSSWLEIFVSTVGGGGLGFASSAWTGSHARRKERKAEIRRSYAAYLGAFYQALSAIRELPEVPPAGPRQAAYDRLRAKFDDKSAPPWAVGAVKRIEAAAWIRTQERIENVTGGRLREVSGRVAAAGAFLQVLPLPNDARAAVERANEYLIRLGSDRSPEALAEYPDIYAALRAAGKQMENW
jgi:hypothetical protein